MITHPNIARGEAVRRALLAIVEARHLAGLPMPKHETLGAVLGISAPTVTRHLGLLQDEGAFTTRCAGRHIQIEELAA
jgi:hypothetical protein